MKDLAMAFAERGAHRGRRIVLATAADLAIAQKIQRRFLFISEVLASTDGLNLKGSAKADRLARLFPDGFVYAGDSPADLHVWKKASGAIFVGRSAALAKRIAREVDLQAVLLTKAAPLRSLTKGLRIHQWAKNTLVFVPLVLGGRLADGCLFRLGRLARRFLSLARPCLRFALGHARFPFASGCRALW